MRAVWSAALSAALEWASIYQPLRGSSVTVAGKAAVAAKVVVVCMNNSWSMGEKRTDLGA